MKRTICFDFDGVIHSYVSGWHGDTVIKDPVVEGIAQAIKDIRDAGYQVIIQSTRCKTLNGVHAIRKYLKDNNIEVDGISSTTPPAIVYIDDRAIRFDGNAASLLEKVNSFKPWNVRE